MLNEVRLDGLRHSRPKDDTTYREQSALVRQQLCGLSVAVNTLHGDTLPGHSVCLSHAPTAAPACAEQQGLVHGIAMGLKALMNTCVKNNCFGGRC